MAKIWRQQNRKIFNNGNTAYNSCLQQNGKLIMKDMKSIRRAVDIPPDVMDGKSERCVHLLTYPRPDVMDGKSERCVYLLMYLQTWWTACLRDVFIFSWNMLQRDMTQNASTTLHGWCSRYTAVSHLPTILGGWCSRHTAVRHSPTMLGGWCSRHTAVGHLCSLTITNSIGVYSQKKKEKKRKHQTGGLYGSVVLHCGKTNTLNPSQSLYTIQSHMNIIRKYTDIPSECIITHIAVNRTILPQRYTVIAEIFVRDLIL